MIEWYIVIYECIYILLYMFLFSLCLLILGSLVQYEHNISGTGWNPIGTKYPNFEGKTSEHLLWISVCNESLSCSALWIGFGAFGQGLEFGTYITEFKGLQVKEWVTCRSKGLGGFSCFVIACRELGDDSDGRLQHLFSACFRWGVAMMPCLQLQRELR